MNYFFAHRNYFELGHCNAMLLFLIELFRRKVELYRSLSHPRESAVLEGVVAD